MNHSLRAAAIQMTAEVGNIPANLEKAGRLVDEAASKGARLIVLPEFFPSAVAYHPSLLEASLNEDGKAGDLLLSKARQHQAYVGGSFIVPRGQERYNTFILAMPDGRTASHDKDQPTMWENCYYSPGSDDGVLQTPLGSFGAVLCWEFIRNRTAHRLMGRVDCVVGGSCWWTVPMNWPPRTFWDWHHQKNLGLMSAAPSTLSKILGVPVVHAAHAGEFTSRTPLMPGAPYSSWYLGESQIVDGSGTIAARMKREDGEGVITAEVTLGRVPPSMGSSASFWIPKLPALFHFVWTYQNMHGRRYYARLNRKGNGKPVR